MVFIWYSWARTVGLTFPGLVNNRVRLPKDTMLERAVDDDELS